MGTRLLMIVNSALAGIIVARWLGVEATGQLAVINVSVATVVQFASFGLPSANTYFIAKDANQLKSAAINSLLFALICGSLLGVGLATLAQLRPSWFGFVPTGLIRVAAVSIPFQLATLIGLNLFLAIGKVREFNLLDLFGQSFALINVLLVVLALHAGLNVLVALNSAASISTASVTVALVIFAASQLGLKNTWRGDLFFLGRTIEYGLKSHLAIVAGALIFRADLLIVNHFRGAAEAGVYSVASQMAMLLMLLPSVIATLLFPKVTEEQDISGATTVRVARHTALIMLACCLTAAPLSLLVPIVYGRAFSDASTQLLILLPGVFLVSIQSVLVQHFNAMGLPRTVPTFWLITLAINIAMVFALVPAFGARGAAIASTISYAMISALMIGYFCHTTGRSLRELFVLQTAELRMLFRLFRNWTGAPR